MTNFFYYDANGQKQGPVNDQQLKSLAAQGAITAQTPLETDSGHKGQAGQIPGLNFPVAAPSPFAQPQAGPSSQLTIHRPFATYGAAGSYDILMNGQKLGKVANSKTVTFPVPAGFAKLEIKAFGMRLAEPATINITAGQEKKITVRVKKNYHLTLILLILVAIIPGIIYSLVVPPCVIEEQN